MSLSATYTRYDLKFKRPSGTSRGIMTHKESWFLLLEKDGKKGIGECGLLRGLSVDDRPDYEEKLKWVCQNIHLGEALLWKNLMEFPSIQFGVEMAFRSLNSKNPFLLFPSAFTHADASIPINGLVWMGDPDYMKQQIQDKIEAGFSCIKIKIGAIDFEKECALLAFIREHFTPEQMELRVDANGGFTFDSALDKLNQLSEFKLHSIEQPIAKNQPDNMAALCKSSPFPIALDEELIGLFSVADKEAMLKQIRPQYLILKPSLIGGFRGSQEWIALADKFNIGWWITSALESNIGLNAIAQWTFTLGISMPQGLGTGALYTNNFEAPMKVQNGQLWYGPSMNWEAGFFD